ncbi:hypothetical protein ACFWN1_00510 [Streptomyces sp. NPDC058459]
MFNAGANEKRLLERAGLRAIDQVTGALTPGTLVRAVTEAEEILLTPPQP